MKKRCFLHNSAMVTIGVVALLGILGIGWFLAVDVLWLDPLAALCILLVSIFPAGIIALWLVLRRSSCVHEAGHAVMCLFQGLKLVEITTSKVYSFRPDAYPYVQQIKVKLAGAAALEIFGFHLPWCGAETDLREAYEYAKIHFENIGVSYAKEDIELLLKSLLDETMEQLTREKDKIRPLADALAKRGRLGSEQVQRILS